MEHLAKYLHLARPKGRHIVEYAIKNPQLTAEQVAADIGASVSKTRYYLTKFKGIAGPLYERDTSAQAPAPSESPPELAVLLTKLIDRVEDLSSKVEAPFVHTPKTEPKVELTGEVTTEVFWSDLHWHPEHRQGHDPAAYRLALEFLKRRQPDILFFGGDIMDCYAPSRYEKKPRLATPEAYQGEIQYGKERMAEVRGICPDARFIWLTGNHEMRVPRSVHTNAPWLINEIRDVEKALELDSFEVQTVEPGYKIGKLGHYHGHEIAGSGRVNVAKNKFDRYFTNMIFGHHHKFSVWCPRDQEGSYRGAYGNATLHWLSAEYTEYPEWNQGLSEVEYTKSGLFHVNQVLFHKPSVWSSKAEYIYQGEHVSVDLEKTEAMAA